MTISKAHTLRLKKNDFLCWVLFCFLLPKGRWDDTTLRARKANLRHSRLSFVTHTASLLFSAIDSRFLFSDLEYAHRSYVLWRVEWAMESACVEGGNGWYEKGVGVDTVATTDAALDGLN